MAGAFLALRARSRRGRSRGPRARRRGPARWLAAAPRSRRSSLLALAFPEGGTQPFVASAFYPALAGVLVIGSRPDPARARGRLRTGALLYAVALIGAYVIPTAVGGNADRLGALFAGPIAACVLAGAIAGRAPRALAARAGARSCSTGRSNAPVADFASAASDPAVHASYYAPLLAELRRARRRLRGARRRAIEVVPPRDHWEARWVAPARDARARLGAPARHATATRSSTTARALTRRALPRVAVDNAVSYVALPTRRWTTRREARGGRCCADAAGAPLPARSLALGALAAVRGAGARRSPAAGVLTRLARLVHAAAPRAGASRARALHPLLGARERHGCVRARRAAGRGAGRARAACTS